MQATAQKTDAPIMMLKIQCNAEVNHNKNKNKTKQIKLHKKTQAYTGVLNIY